MAAESANSAKGWVRRHQFKLCIVPACIVAFLLAIPMLGWENLTQPMKTRWGYHVPFWALVFTPMVTLCLLLGWMVDRAWRGR